MSLINTADKVFFGANLADKIYMGSSLVWQGQGSITPVVLDQANLIDQWVAQDASVYGEGSRVPMWKGRINGIEATHTDESKQPRYFGGVGGQPGLLFAGSTLNTPYIPTLYNITVYAKVYFSASPTRTMTIACQDTGGNNRSWHFGVNPTSIARFVNFNDNGVSGQSISLSGSVLLNQWFIPGARRELQPDNSVIMYAQHDGQESPAGTVSTTNMQESLYISIGSRGNYTESMDGYIGELRIYRAIHDTTTRQQVRAEMGMLS